MASQEMRSRGELANVLSVSAALAIVFAYSCAFTILGDSAYASKFENGVLPDGVDVANGEVAAVGSLGCAMLAWCLLACALASRVTKTAGVVAVLGVLAAVPYAAIELVAWQLVF